MSIERVIDLFQRYVFDDLCSVDTEFVREKLTDVLGCSKEEIKELGFDFLFFHLD